MVTTKLNLSMTEPQVRQIYAKQGDTGRVLDISLDQTPEDGTLRILRPDGVEVTSDAVTGGEVESGGTFESLTEADVTELTVGIEPMQDLSHGDPSPTNICPITGHDEVTVYFGAEQGTADETYTTSLGQTVYGGTLDMVSGVLTVDRVKWIPKVASVNSVTMTDGNAGYKFNNYSAFSGETLVDTSRLLDATATFLKSGVSNWVTPNAITLGNDGKSFFACLSPSIGISTVSAFNSWITANGYYIVYPLATPQTYLLTPQQIKTLVGTNNVWASSGDIVSIKFTYGGLLSELPSDATSIVGKCYCDVEQNGVSSMPFTLNIKKNERQ